MSDNNLSIDEIIKKAEIIKAQAEQQLKDAQKNLDEMARSAIDEVTIDSEAVMKKVEELSDEEEDIKEFVPSKSKKASEKTIAFPKFSKKKPIKTYNDFDGKEYTQMDSNLCYNLCYNHHHFLCRCLKLVLFRTEEGTRRIY